MGAFFTSGSSQRLSNSAPPTTNYPFSVGLWVYPTTTAVNKDFWSLADTGTTNNWWKIGQNTADNWLFSAQAGGTVSTMAGGTLTANAWAFLLARGISATSRRLDILHADGHISQFSNTQSRAPTGIDRMSLGCGDNSTPGEFFDGNIAEFWYTDTDIQADGAATNSDIVRQLAYGGPFSVPHIGAAVIEYRSLRKTLSSNEDDATEIYSGYGHQEWTNSGGARIGQHPPLPYWFVRPSQTMQNLII